MIKIEWISKTQNFKGRINVTLSYKQKSVRTFFKTKVGIDKTKFWDCKYTIESLKKNTGKEGESKRGRKGGEKEGRTEKKGRIRKKEEDKREKGRQK